MIYCDTDVTGPSKAGQRFPMDTYLFLLTINAYSQRNNENVANQRHPRCA